MVGMKLMDEIASDEVLDQAYEWMCERRKEYSANSDVWDVRWRWYDIKPWLQEQLLEGNYRFDVLRRIHRQNDTIELWSALDALVLKAIAIVLTRRLSFSERCYHLLGHGGAKAPVRDVAENLPNNPFVFRTDVRSYYASIDHDVLLEQLREHIDDSRLLDLLEQYVRRTVVEDGLYEDVTKGISLGCALSPVIGALFLQRLDERMEATGLFYARFMDDWVILAPSRWKLRRLAVLEQDPLAPRLLDPAIDRDLEMVVLKCLQKPPELRYRGADELADELEAYLRGDPISVRTVSLPLLFSRLFRTTHHAAILENWGLLWMWHSLVLIFLCGLTNALWWWDIEEPLAYLGLWTIGFGAWSAIFWSLRRRGGPITFVERQIAHIWGASIIGSSSLFLIEILLTLPVLSLAPVLPLFGVAVFMAKAAVLSGRFYVQAGVFLATSFVMAYLQSVGQTWGVLLFGLVSALCFFIPGLKYYRQVARKK